jgi:D-alanyl-D-alanine carboxypeptidase
VARLALAWVVLLALAGCGGGDDREARPDPRIRLTPALASALDARLREKVADTGVPGASAAVVFADGRAWKGAAGHAVLEPRARMTSRTSLPFDSVTKIATAALALRLVEQGRLALDDPVRRWYRAWRGDPVATVADLLGHTSGARDPPERFWKRVLAHPRRVVSDREFLAAAPQPAPRTDSAEYANAGFTVAGIVLERAGREPLARAMRREVFDHPGGDGLALQPAERPRPPHAHSYWYPRGVGDPVDASDGGPLLPSRTVAGLAGPAGGLAGDVPSLARWGHELLSGRILEPASLRAMRRFGPSDAWDGYGLGLAKSYRNDAETWGHTGDFLGSHTELWHMPSERLTLAVSWNDDVIEDDGGFLPALFQTVLDSR